MDRPDSIHNLDTLMTPQPDSRIAFANNIGHAEVEVWLEPEPRIVATAQISCEIKFNPDNLKVSDEVEKDKALYENLLDTITKLGANALNQAIARRNIDRAKQDIANFHDTMKK